MSAKTTATAYVDWNERWKSGVGRRKWLKPESEVKDIAELLRDIGLSTAMDLGCGIGRHSLFLASLGFKVVALDGSSAGIDWARSLAKKKRLPINFISALMTDLPCADESFDYLLAWNVVYHGDREVVQRSLSEIYRVLRPGGIFQGTMLSKNNFLYKQGCEVAPDTFVFEGEPDKSHPHFYCNQAELAVLFGPMEILRVNDCEHECPGSYHLHFVARKSHPGDGD